MERLLFPWPLMSIWRNHSCKETAILEVDRDPGHPERMAPELDLNTGSARRPIMRSASVRVMRRSVSVPVLPATVRKGGERILDDTKGLAHRARMLGWGTSARLKVSLLMYKPGGTIAAALGRIQQNSYVLPAIQREFVWKFEQIERLFDSLMQRYPFGTFLFWKIDPQTSGQFKFYDFVLNYHQRDAAHCPELPPLHNQAVIAVLDGQQRLTALNIGLRGSMAVKQPNRWWTNPDAFPKRMLRLNSGVAGARRRRLGVCIPLPR